MSEQTSRSLRARNHGDLLIPTDSILILGASTRAAAFSARRAGLIPTCIDLFADRDLSDCCTVTRLAASDFPYGFARVARSAPNGPWIYVGAMENYPELVDRVSTDRPLWGNSSEVLRRVRDPFQLAECLGRVGIRYPAVRAISDKVPACASWLMKPIASAGGRGICQYTVRNAALRRRAVRGMYFQQQLDGQPYAAVFVANRRGAALIGLTRQMIGEPSFHARPFHYCGSIGPLPIERNLLT